MYCIWVAEKPGIIHFGISEAVPVAAGSAEVAPLCLLQVPSNPVPLALATADDG